MFRTECWLEELQRFAYHRRYQLQRTTDVLGEGHQTTPVKAHQSADHEPFLMSSLASPPYCAKGHNALSNEAARWNHIETAACGFEASI